MFANEGYPIIGGVLALAIVLFLAGSQLGGAFEWPLILLGVALLSLTLYRFRAPGRTPPEDGLGDRPEDQRPTTMEPLPPATAEPPAEA